MAQKSGFFNALRTEDGYDRKYNANDYCDNLAVVIGNGVLRSENDDLKVTASGMIATVGVGRAWINGHYYSNDTNYSFAATTAPIGGKRYDRVMLRLNTEVATRSISLVYVEGTAANEPTKPEPTRTNSIYDIVLADIFVDTNATSIQVTDTRADTDICGWVFSTSGDNSFFTSLDNSFMEWFAEKKDTLSSVTLFKRYQWQTTLNSTTNQVAFSIPQYDANTCFIEVYVNGIFENRYTQNNNILTFDVSLIAGTVVTVNCYKSIDGTGIMTIADEITELQNRVNAIEGDSKYTYVCTGIFDNFSLSQIAYAILTGGYGEDDVTEGARAFLERLGGNEALADLPDDVQITINVVGNLGAQIPAGGSGTSTSRYRWFQFGLAENTTKKIVFDFAKCNKINISCQANTSSLIFYGNDVHIRNANVVANSLGANCNIEMIRGSANTGRITADNCRFVISTSGTTQIAEHGTYTNCYVHLTSNEAAAYCFKPKNEGLIRLNGGEYYAYGLTSSGIGSSIIHISASDTDGVAIANNIHCPVVAKTDYSQGFLSVANAGAVYINGVVSRLTSSGSYNTITGQINKNKA